MPSRNVLVAFGCGIILSLALIGSYAWALFRPPQDTNSEIALYTLWLTIFTGVLAAATIWLSLATRKQIVVATKAANAAEASAQHIPRVERAYLTGGGPALTVGGRRFFRIEVENHGKTPAYLCAFDVHFSTLEEVRDGPQEVFPVRLYDDRIKPGAVLKPLDWIPFTRPDADVIYGAFWYQDLLKRERIFRFILRVDQNDQTHVGVSGVDDSYTYWD